jgi:hypothetical protein
LVTIGPQVTVTTTVTAVFAHKLLILIRRLLPLPLLLPQEGVTILAQSPPQSDRKSMNLTVDLREPKIITRAL